MYKKRIKNSYNTKLNNINHACKDNINKNEQLLKNIPDKIPKENNICELIVNFEFNSLKKIIIIYQKFKNKDIGISFYVPEIKTIFSGDIIEAEFCFLESLFEEIEFDLFLVYIHSDAKISELLKKIPSIKIKKLNFFYFNYSEISYCIKKFLELENSILADFINKNYFSPKDSKSISLNENKNKISTEIFNFNEISINTKLISILENLNENGKSALYITVDILTKAIQSTDFIYESPNDFFRISFEKLEYINSLLISKKSLKDLKIFDEKFHPSQIKGKGRSKEGVSLFWVFNKCATSQGKKLMKNIFSNPLKNYEIILKRQECISDFSLLKNHELIRALIKNLNEIKDIEKILKELKNFIINKKYFKFLFKTITSFLFLVNIFMKEILNRNNTKFTLLNEILENINLDNIENLYEFMVNCMDFPKEDENVKLKTNINEDLDSLRKEYNSLDEILSKHAIEYSKNIPRGSFMEKFMIIFLPQLGYMLAVEKNSKYKFFVKKSYEMYERCLNGFSKEEEIKNEKSLLGIIIGNMSIEIVCNSNYQNNQIIDNNNDKNYNNENEEFLKNNFDEKDSIDNENDKIKNINDEDSNKELNKISNKDNYNNSNKKNNNPKIIFSQNFNIEKNKFNSDKINTNKGKKFCNKKNNNFSESTINEIRESDIYSETEISNYNQNFFFDNKEDMDENEEESKNNKTNKKDEESEYLRNTEDDIDEYFDLTNSEETEILSKIFFKDVKIDFQFHTETIIYFKNGLTAKLDEEFGDLSAKITDIENAIFRQISKQILQHEKDLLLMNEFMSNLDVYLNFSLISDQYNLTKPYILNDEFNSENKFYKKKKNKINTDFEFNHGRNILCELITEKNYVTNDFFVKNKNIIFIAGNISSGKSIFLKLIGNLVYLAQIGMKVPANNFSFYIFEKIFSIIENTENAIDNISGFTTELKDMKMITDYLKQMKKNLISGQNLNDYLNTLILIDDPFKRTSFHNKCCLLVGFIKYLNEMVEILNRFYFSSRDFKSKDKELTLDSSNKNDKANFKIFITINKEILEILLKNKIINFDISEIFHFDEKLKITDLPNFDVSNDKKKNLIGKFSINMQNNENQTFIANKIFLEQYKLKIFDNYDIETGRIKDFFDEKSKYENNGALILLAKEYGLDFNLFFNSMNFLEEFKSEMKLLPRIDSFKAILYEFKIKSYLIKISKNFGDLHQRLKDIIYVKGRNKFSY